MGKKIFYSFLILFPVLSILSPSSIHAEDIEKVAVKCLMLNTEGVENTYDPSTNSIVIQSPAKAIHLTGQIAAASDVQFYINTRNNQEPARLIGKTVSDLKGNFLYKDKLSMKDYTIYVYSATYDRKLVDLITPQTQKHSGFTPLINPMLPNCHPLVGLASIPPTPTPQPPPPVRTDPYGIVFDSVSLEPLPQVEVTLLGEKKFFYDDPEVPNPVTTKENGKFSFLPHNGTYFLNVKKNGYVFPSQNKSITDPRYSEFYYGDPIVVFDKIEHRDVPVDPVDPKNPYHSPPQITSSFIYTTGPYTEIYGEVTHPGSLVEAKQKNITIATAYASSRGFFKMVIANSRIDETVPIDLIASKPKTQAYHNNIFTSLSKLFQVHAQSPNDSTSQPVSLMPIITNLKGYALDKEGKPVGSAEVRLIDRATGGILSILQADLNGYFTVSDEDSSRVPYYVEIRKPLGKIPEALWEPKDLLAEKEESAAPGYISTNQPLWPQLKDSTPSANKLPPPYGPDLTVEEKPTAVSPTQTSSDRNAIQEKSKLSNQSTDLSIVLLVSLVLLIMLIGVMLYIIWRKKKVSDQHMPDTPEAQPPDTTLPKP